MTKQASPKKLDDNSWGAWVKGKVEEGEIITITTSKGNQWDAQVTKVLKSFEKDGEPLCLVKTRSIEGPPPRKEEPELPPVADGSMGYSPEDFTEDDIPF